MGALVQSLQEAAHILGCGRGESMIAERLEPGMMSRCEVASDDQGVSMIARSMVSVRGEDSTSAMSRVLAGSPSSPRVESPCGSRSTTRVFTP